MPKHKTPPSELSVVQELIFAFILLDVVVMLIAFTSWFSLFTLDSLQQGYGVLITSFSGMSALLLTIGIVVTLMLVWRHLSRARQLYDWLLYHRDEERRIARLIDSTGSPYSDNIHQYLTSEKRNRQKA